MSRDQIFTVVSEANKDFCLCGNAVDTIVDFFVYRSSIHTNWEWLVFPPDKILMPGEFDPEAVCKQACINCGCALKRMNGCILVSFKKIKEMYDNQLI